MTYVSPNLHDLSPKADERAKIDADVAAFLARGGRVTVVPAGACAAEGSPTVERLAVEAATNRKRKAAKASADARRRRKAAADA